MNFEDALKDIESLSHAYMIEGSEHMRDALLAHLASIGFDAARNPDAFVRTYESFGIDESREVAIRATRKPLQAIRNIFIITAPSMTAEAQNALLKTFEEPSSIATFFLITPSVEVLLPTLRSRMQQVIPEGVSAKEALVSAAAFLASPIGKRLKLIDPLVKERKPGEVIAFLAELERALAPDMRDSKEARDALRAVYRAENYSRDKGSLLKILLEQVAILSPRM
jgi:hypothetical protein